MSRKEMATTTTEHAAEGASAGMPQLDFSTFPNQIFWLLVTLIILYVVLSRVALPRIGSVLANRRGTISADLQAAEKLKQQAVNAEKSYNQALIQARGDAAAILAEAKADIQKVLDKAIAKADAEIGAKAAEAAKAMDEIRAGAADAIVIVAKDTATELVLALGGTADAKAITAAVSARLKG
jgi:F-type H+-transporting ATPase subunit b